MVCSSSLLHLMRAITLIHASTRTTSLKRVKNSTRHFCLWHLLSGTLEQRKQKKELKLNTWSFSLTFANLSLAWMLYFHVWLQNKRKFLVWSECYNQFAIYQPSCASLLESLQSNLSNPQAYSEPCQTPKMENFEKIVNG